jgi:hypothetical protein
MIIVGLKKNLVVFRMKLYRDHPDGQRELKAIYRGRHLFESKA